MNVCIIQIHQRPYDQPSYLFQTWYTGPDEREVYVKTTVAVWQSVCRCGWQRIQRFCLFFSQLTFASGPLTQSAALFKTSRLTTGEPEGAASFHLSLSSASSPARQGLLVVKDGVLLANSLRA